MLKEGSQYFLYLIWPGSEKLSLSIAGLNYRIAETVIIDLLKKIKKLDNVSKFISLFKLMETMKGELLKL